VIANPPANPQQGGKDALTGSQIFGIFEHIITTVLGVPSLPKGLDDSGLDLSLWSVEALMRARAEENAKDSVEALSSIIKLVEKIQNMPVGKDVRDGVLAALEELEAVSSPLLLSSQITTLTIWHFLCRCTTRVLFPRWLP
jgi:phosphatidylinositol glycan class S